MYNPNAVSSQFDEFGEREWQRLTATPTDEVSLYIHNHYLRQYIPTGASVLEIGAGAGRFTQTLAEIGARVVVADISQGQLELNRKFAAQYGFAHAVEDWQKVDITDLSRYSDEAFDHVIAYGGPFSYVLDRRDVALRECVRVVKPGGFLLASVMTLWGSATRSLTGTLAVPVEANHKITTTGDLTAETFPGRTRGFMHLFRAEEVRAWVVAAGLHIMALSASGVLSVAWENRLVEIRQDSEKWNELLRMELDASADPGCLGMGTHLIMVGKKGV